MVMHRMRIFFGLLDAGSMPTYENMRVPPWVIDLGHK